VWRKIGDTSLHTEEMSDQIGNVENQLIGTWQDAPPLQEIDIGSSGVIEHSADDLVAQRILENMRLSGELANSQHKDCNGTSTDEHPTLTPLT
jgi:hypothetical protein